MELTNTISPATIAATVVLYNPADDVFENVSSYAGQVAKVFVVDNSTRYNETLIQRLRALPNVVYLNNGGNLGIARALNAGAAAAQGSYNYLLTMDQDTALTFDFVSRLATGFQTHTSAAIIAPLYTQPNNTSGKAFETVAFTMTSGNILRLDAYKKAGPFMDELFIDHVDHEYCLRLRSHGYSIVQDNSVFIAHRPGNVIGGRVLSRDISFSSHSPLRFYYFVRNGFYVSRLYQAQFPDYGKFFRKQLMKEFAKLIFESRKGLRIKYFFKAWRDYRSNNLGPCQD
ncbi:glycosyltransferase [Chryseolinea sp. T2]|uniref:glycosyltransferase n=1 Tax=Chryseolinea sp. T2 TaxID=3129255 RepID=UPI003077A4D6